MLRSVPTKLAGIYLLLGGLWIVLSDRVLYLSGHSAQEITELQTYKGWLFIVLSGALIYALARYYLASLDRARVALVQSEARFQGFMRHAPAITFIKDPETGRYVFVNQKASVLHEAGVPLFAGKTDAEVFPADEVRALRATGERALAENRPIDTVFRCHAGKDGPTDWLLIQFPLAGEGGRRLVGGIAVDITDRVRAQEQLRTAKEAAEASSRAKDQFLSVLSHELRTPLTPALLTASSLEHDPALPQEVRDDAATIRQQVEIESRLIDDLLDLTRITSGRLEVRPKALDVHALLRNTVRMLQAEVREKDLTITWRLGAATHYTHADPDRLRQCFWNLLGNSIKFTPVGGTITVATHNTNGAPRHGRNGDAAAEAAAEPNPFDLVDPHANDSRSSLVVEFTDTGVGIAPDVIPRLFQAFQQADQTLTREYGGLGLGLSICKAIVDLHGGDISGSSDGPGKGATFKMVLPAIPAPAAEVGTESFAPAVDLKPQGRRILVVEDEPITQNVLARLLRSLGYNVSTASTVAQGVQTAAQYPFDLLISDIGLPDGSGWDLLRQLGDRRPPRAIAISGYGTETDVRSSHDAGFDAHLTKPIDLPQLKKALFDLAPHM